MKILLLCDSISRVGGIDKVNRDIINALKQYIELDIILLNEKKIEYESVDIFFTNLPKVGKFFKRYFLKRKIDEKKFNFIMVTHPFILKYIDKSLMNKTIMWAWGIDVWGQYGAFIKKEINSVKNILTISNFTKLRIVSDLEVKANKIEIIPNCIELDSFTYKSLNKFLPFTLLTVGRLDANEQYKGHDLVIKALAQLKEKNLNIIYNIVGDGTDRKRLEKLAKDLKVDNQVNFLGKVSFDEIKKAYHDCHLFIMPSFYSIRPDGYATGEGFGIVYLEAGASGRAVIGCDVGGQTDYIRDGINGLLVKPDERDIAQKIESLYGKFDLLEKMGRNGRKIVEEEFSMDRFERDLKNFLKEITNVNKV